MTHHITHYSSIMSASWATPGSVIETSNQMDDDSKLLRQKKLEQQRAIQQQRMQQKRQVVSILNQFIVW